MGIEVKNDGNPESLELKKIYRTLPDTDAAKHEHQRRLRRFDLQHPRQRVELLALGDWDAGGCRSPSSSRGWMPTPGQFVVYI